ncbi:MAG: UV DNA damage repair endonuclease UvsE [Kiritimatiellaeota bacterium]|nr:UV DNA damage repair endonuclease UvsE [Kiritimatiellota bacterium]
MIRLGLCCLFLKEPIRFRTTTARAMMRLDRATALEKTASLCLHNGRALLQALKYCVTHGIGDFRVNSQILPLRTHPQTGYRVSDLPGAQQIIAAFRQCGRFAQDNALRLTFHPDQFIILSSPHSTVTESSLAELDYQAEVAEWVNADVINIHGGGAYGDKHAALARLRKALQKIPDRIRRRLTLENDERVYTPRDLLAFCRSEGVPLVYDVHHHRCLPDGYSVSQATDLAVATWNREPLLHVSSPKDGWRKPRPSRHHDYINPRDFPPEWMHRDFTVEVEAKAKELAVERLAKYLRAHGVEDRDVSRARSVH